MPIKMMFQYLQLKQLLRTFTTEEILNNRTCHNYNARVTNLKPKKPNNKGERKVPVRQ